MARAPFGAELPRIPFPGHGAAAGRMESLGLSGCPVLVSRCRGLFRRNSCSPTAGKCGTPCRISLRGSLAPSRALCHIFGCQGASSAPLPSLAQPSQAPSLSGMQHLPGIPLPPRCQPRDTNRGAESQGERSSSGKHPSCWKSRAVPAWPCGWGWMALPCCPPVPCSGSQGGSSEQGCSHPAHPGPWSWENPNPEGGKQLGMDSSRAAPILDLGSA